jgi:hypothetical protein
MDAMKGIGEVFLWIGAAFGPRDDRGALVPILGKALSPPPKMNTTVERLLINHPKPRAQASQYRNNRNHIQS